MFSAERRSEKSLSQLSRQFFAVADEDFILLLLSTLDGMVMLDEVLDMFSIRIYNVILLREIVKSKECRLARDLSKNR